jgi:hypothetical protein
LASAAQPRSRPPSRDSSATPLRDARRELAPADARHGERRREGGDAERREDGLAAEVAAEERAPRRPEPEHEAAGRERERGIARDVPDAPPRPCERMDQQPDAEADRHRQQRDQGERVTDPGHRSDDTAPRRRVSCGHAS